jgi:hypothetical protein
MIFKNIFALATLFLALSGPASAVQMLEATGDPNGTQRDGRCAAVHGTTFKFIVPDSRRANVEPFFSGCGSRISLQLTFVNLKTGKSTSLGYSSAPRECAMTSGGSHDISEYLSTLNGGDQFAIKGVVSDTCSRMCFFFFFFFFFFDTNTAC